MNYIFHIIVVVSIYGTLGLAQHLLLGRGGMLFVAQGGLLAVGAYTAGIVLIHSANMFLAFGVAGLMAVAIGCPLGLPALRLRGDYLLVASLGWCEILRSILNNWDSVTGGAAGLLDIPQISLLGFDMDSPGYFAILALILWLLAAALYRAAECSPFGRLLDSLGEDEELVRGLGKSVQRVRLVTIAFSSFWSGIAGAVWASYLGYLDPTSFTLWESVVVLAMVVLGGANSMKGVFVGTAMLVALPEALRFMGLPQSVASPLRQVLFGIILILTMRFMPQGLFGDEKPI